MRKGYLAATALIFLLPLCTLAQTTLKATIGWGNSFRIGRWTPIYVTLADYQTRSVILKIHALYGFGAGMEIHQTVVAERQPKVFCLLFPINADAAKISVIATDEESGKTLASEVPQNPANFTAAGHTPLHNLGAGETLIGIGGDVSDGLRIGEILTQAGLPNGVLTTAQLPA